MAQLIDIGNCLIIDDVVARHEGGIVPHTTDEMFWTRGGFQPVGALDVLNDADAGLMSWGLGHYYPPENILPVSGDFTRVLQWGYLVDGPAVKSASLRLTNVAGTHRWQLWNDTDSVQIGSDSGAQSLGAKMLVNLFRDPDNTGSELILSVDGSTVLTEALTFLLNLRTFGGLGAGFWSGWQSWTSVSDDLNVAHYPELHLMHPNGQGFFTDYTFDYTRLDDLVANGLSDGDATWQAGNDGTNQRETFTLTNPPAMTNTIVAMAGLLRLRQDFTIKAAVHGGLFRIGGSNSIFSHGSEDIGLTFSNKAYILNVEPSTGTWTDALVNGAEFGHRRDAGTTAFNYRITTGVAMSIGFGATDVAPALPDLSLPVMYRRSYPTLHRG